MQAAVDSNFCDERRVRLYSYVSMIDRIASDEGLQVLLFICLPLSLLLVGLLMLLVKRSRRTATFSTFSVSILKIGPQQTRVTYQDTARSLVFEALITRGGYFFTPAIQVAMPNGMPDDDLREVVRNLGCGLADLHYQYLIYRKLEPLPISDAERNAAIDALSEIGVEVDCSGDLQRTSIRDWQRTMGEGPEGGLPQLLNLMNKARAFQDRLEVLAKSENLRSG